jgi:hypothetical protein
VNTVASQTEKIKLMYYLSPLEKVTHLTAFLPAPNCLRFVVVDWDLDRTAEAEETPDEEFPMARLEQARQPL